jgi:hypothetical protein
MEHKPNSNVKPNVDFKHNIPLNLTFTITFKHNLNRRRVKVTGTQPSFKRDVNFNVTVT